MGTKITVICREEGFPNSILIYHVEVKDPHDTREVEAAVQLERERDIEDANTMEILFAFEGDLPTIHDWRE